MTTIEIPKDLRLGEGRHDGWGEGACLLEACAYFAGEPWSDRPECVSPVLGAYGRELNDSLPDGKRQRLVPLIPRLIGTAGDPAADERRSYLALDWLIRTYLPTWLRIVPQLVSDADAIAGMSPITDLESAAAIGGMVRQAASHAAATQSVTAVGSAAARGAARATSAGLAAWDAARATIAEATAGAADAWAAYVGDDLAPTVDALQDSAIDLFDMLIEARS